jgi:hypothetical protein
LPACLSCAISIISSSSKQQQAAALVKCTVCERIEHLTVIQASPAPPPLHHPRTTQPQSVARSITVLPNQVLQDQRRLDTPCASRHSTPPAAKLLSSPNALPWSSSTCKHNNPFSTNHGYQTSNSRGQAHSQIHGIPQRSASCLKVNGRIHLSTVIRTVPPTFDNCMDALCSPSGWDRIDNMTENAQQAPAACTARLAPFGACCILHQNSGVESRESRQIRFTRNPEMATPRGFGGRWRFQPCCAIAAVAAAASLPLPRLSPLAWTS